MKTAVENCDRACKAFQLQITHQTKHSTEDKTFWMDRWKIGMFGQKRIKTFERQLGDCKDNTLEILLSELNRIQGQGDKVAFNSATTVKKDFGADIEMSVEDRHSFAAQGPRRKAIGRARNYLLYSTMKPEHSWVYWRDVDITDSPDSIIEDFVAHDRDILVPSMFCQFSPLSSF